MNEALFALPPLSSWAFMVFMIGSIAYIMWWFLSGD